MHTQTTIQCAHNGTQNREKEMTETSCKSKIPRLSKIFLQRERYDTPTQNDVSNNACINNFSYIFFEKSIYIRTIIYRIIYFAGYI